MIAIETQINKLVNKEFRKMSNQEALYVTEQFCERVTFRAMTLEAVSHIASFAIRYGEVKKLNKTTFQLECYGDCGTSAINAIIDSFYSK